MTVTSLGSADPSHKVQKEESKFPPLLWLQKFRQNWRRSLQFRAVAAAGVLFLTMFTFVGSFLSHQIADSLFRSRLEQALDESQSGFTNVQSLLNNSDASGQDNLQKDVSRFLTVLQTGATDSSRQWVLVPLPGKSNGFISEQSQSGTLSASDIPAALQQEVADNGGILWKTSSITKNNVKTPVLFVGSQVKIPQNPNYGLYLVYDLSPSQRTMNYINMVVWLSCAILLTVVLSIVWLISRLVLRPISSAAITAEKLAAGDLDQRVQINGETEASRLGLSFNKMADSLQDQISRLETLSTMQQRFVSDVSHELRTPLTTVRMAAELLYDGRENLEASYRRPTELLYHQVDRFDSLLADLLEISRFDAGSATLAIVSVEFMAVVNDVLQAAEPHAQKAGIQVRVHAEDVAGLRVEMDHRRIERVLRNLLFNAIEHCEGKPIDLYIAASESAVGVAVRDHGVGLSEEHIKQVFNRFWRADPSRKRTLGGTGLGLSIAAEDVRLHAGALEAWGRIGDGACFRMTLPLTQSQAMGQSPVLLSGQPDDHEAHTFSGILNIAEQHDAS